MDLTFKTPRLKQTCESAEKLRRAYGEACAKKMRARLRDFEAAATLEEFRALPGHCHELEADRKGQLALDLADGMRLIFVPTTEPYPAKEDGGLDWRGVDAVQVIEIVDYHG